LVLVFQIVVVRITFARDLAGSLLVDFLPVVVSVLVGHLTNYFDNFEVATGANLTILLVLVTL
jgi:hypothetical protein